MKLKKIKKWVIKNKHLLILISIVFLSAVTRFYKLHSLFHWTLDEEYWAYLPRNIATGQHFPLIGGHISGTGLYSGPIFVWLMGLVFFIIRSNPFILSAVLSILGVVSTFFVYKTTRLVTHHLPTAYISGLLYAGSTLATLYDRKYWNAFPLVFLSILSIYFTHKLTQKSSQRHALFLSLVLIVSIHAHMAGAVLILFSFLTLLIHKRIKPLILILAMVVTSHTSLLIFELRHDFQLTKNLSNLFSESRSSHQSFVGSFWLTSNLSILTTSRLLYTPAQDIANEMTHCPQLADQRNLPPPPYIFLAGLILLTGIVRLRHQDHMSLLLASNAILLFLYFLIFPSDQTYQGLTAEYFLLPSFPAIIVFSAHLIWKLKKNSPLLLYCFLSLIVIINLHTTFNLTHSQNFPKKHSLVKQVIQATGKTPYSLYASGHPCHIYGYRYLLTLKNHEPVISYLDNNFLWLYQNQLPKEPAQLKVTIDVDSDTILVKDVDPKNPPTPQN